MDLETGLVIARSITLRDFPEGQFVIVISGLFSFKSLVVGEKVTSSSVELRLWLLAVWSITRRTALWILCRDPSTLQEDEI